MEVARFDDRFAFDELRVPWLSRIWMRCLEVMSLCKPALRASQMGSDRPLRGAIRFGSFELDLRAGELRKQGVKIKLQEQPLQILAALLEHPGQVVTREDLRTRLWSSDTFVDFDHSLNKAINKLREALGDSADSPRFIETLAKRGYRFMDSSPTTAAGASIAVLPFLNLSTDPDNELFADGMSEEIISAFASMCCL